MNLYLGLADDELKQANDEPTIGLILCKTNNKIVAEYALRDTSKPIGIAEYKIAEMLPEDIKGELPSIQEIEEKLDEELKGSQRPVDTRLRAIKDKLKALEVDELRTPATYQILQDLFLKGLEPMYNKIIQKLSEEFDNEFLRCSYQWTCGQKTLPDIWDLRTFWKEEENLRVTKEIVFNYRLFGFRKAGTENSNASLELTFEMSTYWYGFTCTNYNGEQPFLKKMYHQPITKENIQSVEDVLISQMLDRIHLFISNIDGNND